MDIAHLHFIHNSILVEKPFRQGSQIVDPEISGDVQRYVARAEEERAILYALRPERHILNLFLIIRQPT